MFGNTKVLIIDNNAERREELNTILQFLGESPIVATSSNWKTKVQKDEPYFTAIVGDCDDDSNFSHTLRDIHKWKPNLPWCLLEVRALEDTLAKEIRQHYVGNINQPFAYAQLLDILYHCQIAQENSVFKPETNNDGADPLFRSMVGISPSIKEVRSLIEHVANSDVTALILGESGTGKEVAARNIHYQSGRRDKPFVPINCGAIPGELLESELFGHEKGAFSGAITARQGRFELARGGTLFLDEIGDMPIAMLVKILRVLQEKTFERVGSNKSIQADVRVIAATHRNLEEEIEKWSFREDLFYRLNVFPIEMPALRHRIEDIPLLINELIARIEAEGRGPVRFMPAAIKALAKCPWYGNIRELANLIERLTILYPSGIVDVSDLPSKLIQGADQQEQSSIDASQSQIVSEQAISALPNEGFDLKDHLVKTELALISQALDESDWIVARAAEYLHMRRTTLVEKMRKYGISRPEVEKAQHEDV